MRNTPEEASRSGSPRRRLIWLGAGTLCVALVAGACALPVLIHPTAHAPAPAQLATAKVTKGQLIDTKKLTGTLGYSGSHDVGSVLPGTITWVPDAGATVNFGEKLLSVDNEPVLLLSGSTPAWRPIIPGMTAGPDIAQLAESLRALGYYDGPETDSYGWALQSAVETWQLALGEPQTGTLPLGSIVFASAPLRIAEVKTPAGAPSGPAALTVTSGDKSVSVLLDTSQSALAAQGAKVSIQLPGGATTAGTITSVGAAFEQQDPGGGSAKVKRPVTIALDDAAAASDFDNVGVSVDFTRVVKEDALQVPIAAIVATSASQVAVTVADSDKAGAKQHSVAVELGAFAGGNVEVSSPELQPGDLVVVAQ